MEAHKERIPAVMLGVGAAFDFHTGRVRQAPGWMQVAGPEWLFRLLMDPRRLWKRYARHNPRFVGLFLLQLLGFSGLAVSEASSLEQAVVASDVAFRIDTDCAMIKFQSLRQNVPCGRCIGCRRIRELSEADASGFCDS